MVEILPKDIQRDLERAHFLHQRATADYTKCEEFCKLMSSLLSRLENASCFNIADKVMGMLLECNPKIGTHCDKAVIVGQKIQKLGEKYT